jgi:macrolide transport system ATP-binding/permease protein
MQTLQRDIRFAFRQLWKNFAFSIMAILTLALGIGVNTAVFSVVNGWLRPLPVPDADRLVVLAAQQKDDILGAFYFSYPALVDFRNQSDAFSDIFADQIGLGGLTMNGKTESFVFSYVTGNFFSGLGVKPELGRLLLPDEEKPGGPPVVVLGYSYWKKRFNGDPSVVGKQVRVDGNPAVIVGIAGKGFHGAHSGIDFSGYLPLSMMTAQETRANGLWTDRNQRILAVMARLKPGLNLTQAQASLNLVARQVALAYPKTDDGITVAVVPERLSRPVPRVASAIPVISGLFLALAGFVLLLTCMNVANLLLVRATARKREMAVRAALGATGKRLIRQVLTESIVLSLLGGIVGLALGMSASAWISSLQLGTNLPLLLDFGFDWRVFTYGLAAAVLTGIVVGVWPAMRASSATMSAGLQEGRSDSAGGSRHRVRKVLVVAQVAGSLVLLIVAARFVRSLEHTQHLSLGFDPDNVLNVMLDPHQVGYDETRTTEFYRELKRRISAVPGVQSATSAFSIPMGNYNDGGQVYVEGQALAPGQQPPIVLFNRVDADYFKTMQIPLVRGRAFSESDDVSAPLVAIINQAMANQMWRDQDPVGKRFSTKSGAGPFIQVIGVAHDSRLFGYFSGALPYYYVPIAQNYSAMRIVQVRSAVASESLVSTVQREIQSLDPEMPISDLQTMREAMAGGNGFLVFRLGASLTATMGLLGLIIATVGIYGVVSFAASQRTREIGVRLALGASRMNILNLILGQGVRLVTLGVVIGLLAAFMLTRAMAGLLVNVSPGDPATSVPVALLLMLVALTACYVPASRATRVDPMVALRCE